MQILLLGYLGSHFSAQFLCAFVALSSPQERLGAERRQEPHGCTQACKVFRDNVSLTFCPYCVSVFMSLAIFSPFILLGKETYGGFCLIEAIGNCACYRCLCPEPLFSGATQNLTSLIGPFGFHVQLVSQSAFSLDECHPNDCVSIVFCHFLYNLLCV